MSECLYSSTAREKVTLSEKLEHGEVGERKYRQLQHHSVPFPHASKWRRLVPKEVSPNRERWNASVIPSAKIQISDIKRDRQQAGGGAHL